MPKADRFILTRGMSGRRRRGLPAEAAASRSATAGPGSWCIFMLSPHGKNGRSGATSPVVKGRRVTSKRVDSITGRSTVRPSTAQVCTPKGDGE